MLSAFSYVGPQQGLQFRFGIVSDVQYADIKDGHSFLGTPRYYRASLDGLKRAVLGWKNQQVEFGIQFGDLIDGFNPKDKSETALKSVLDEFALLYKPVYHVIGNHCLYNLPRKRLNEALGIHGTSSYYSFSPHQAWRFVVIDAYDVSMLGWPESHPLYQQAKAILDDKNINEVIFLHAGLIIGMCLGCLHACFAFGHTDASTLCMHIHCHDLHWAQQHTTCYTAECACSPCFFACVWTPQPRWVMPYGRMQNKNNPEGHEGPARRFVQFGGGISAGQLDWFVQQLADARAADQRVIVCGHLPMHPGTCIGTCLLWNYEEVLQAIWDAGNVVATISGHAHNVSLHTPMHGLPCVRQATARHCVQAAHANMLIVHVLG